MEISLINVNVSYKRVTSSRFSELFLCLLFLKNNQLKIILTPKRHILRWQILLPFTFQQLKHTKLFPASGPLHLLSPKPISQVFPLFHTQLAPLYLNLYITSSLTTLVRVPSTPPHPPTPPPLRTPWFYVTMFCLFFFTALTIAGIIFTDSLDHWPSPK